MMVIIAMLVFVLSHVLIARSGLKALLVRWIGSTGYLVGYSLLSFALLAWVIAALIAADRNVFWSPPTWGYAFAGLATLLAFPLIAIGSLSPNPLSVSFRKSGYDPRRPGIIGWTRHPILWGMTLWAVAHIPANGDWPSLILFAGSAGFSLLGIWAVERRMKRKLGPDAWSQLQPSAGHMDASAWQGLALGILLWAGLLLAHSSLFGADPLSIFLSLLPSS